MSKITRMGIDLGKNTFHVCAMDRSGRVVLEKRFTRGGLEKFVRAHERCVVGMEACGGAHHWARELRAMGYDARLMSGAVRQGVREVEQERLARCGGDLRGGGSSDDALRAAVKTVEQQSIQHLHRARSMAVRQRTALANQMRGMLFEYGLVVAQGMGTLRRGVPELVEDADNGLPMAMRELLASEREELVRLDERVKRFDAQLDAFAREDQGCRRLQTIPGVGPKVASALVAAARDAKEFGSAREFAAWLGLTPRQRSTGGRTVLGGISKRGDRYGLQREDSKRRRTASPWTPEPGPKVIMSGPQIPDGRDDRVPPSSQDEGRRSGKRPRIGSRSRQGSGSRPA